MNIFDYLVLVGLLVGVAGFSMWRTRGQRDLHTYVHGARNTHWLTIGLAVMATQASAITFLSTPGQGYESGTGFVQNYFGTPIALLIVAIVFVPIYRRLDVDTAYEYLGRRFDTKTRVLGTVLFLVLRGISAGITIYAPAIVLSKVFGWRLDVTIAASGLFATAYTMSGGSAAVNLTQKYQMGVIFASMVTAGVLLVLKLPSWISFRDALTIAGGLQKLRSIDFTFDLHPRYTFWNGIVGGTVLALSYFGTDQSQVQRYLSGGSARESRLGLMFNAVFKVPMQFSILLLGVLLFVFYQFERPPLFFDNNDWKRIAATTAGAPLRQLENEFGLAHATRRADLRRWVEANRRGDVAAASDARLAAIRADDRVTELRSAAKQELERLDPGAPIKDTDYVFITFIVQYLPHGLIGLLVTAFFAAALNSKAAELNALASSSTIDVYRRVRPNASDAECVRVTRALTALWGLLAIAFALTVTLAENLIEWSNIVGSLFYGVMLGLFLIAFFLKRVGGTATFWAAVVSQIGVLVMYHYSTISYLWFNAIGCIACVALAGFLQLFLPRAIVAEPS